MYSGVAFLRKSVYNTFVKAKEGCGVYMPPVGNRIKKRRKELGLSVEDVAFELGKNRATVYRYESNDIENMPASVLEPLAEILQTTPAYLMGWEDDPNDYENMDGFIPNKERLNFMVESGIDYKEALAREYAIQNMPQEESSSNPVVEEIEEILNSMSDEELTVAKNVLLAIKKQP